jgi:hypothetical protein
MPEFMKQILHHGRSEAGRDATARGRQVEHEHHSRVLVRSVIQLTSTANGEVAILQNKLTDKKAERESEVPGAACQVFHTDRSKCSLECP